MEIPPAVKPSDQVTTIGRVFNTPLVVKGKTWLPLTQLITWGIMAWFAGKKHPERSSITRLGTGALTMPVILGSEWGHNLAHAAAADRVGKPMDVMRVVWGMPRVVYYDIQDKQVTPRQHIMRALGGPVFNAMLIPAALFWRALTKPGTVWRDVANAALRTNAFLCTMSLLPIPGIDGGPILKWTMVERGHTIEEADLIVRKVDGVLGVLLGIAGVAAFKKKHRLLGAFLVQLSALSFGVSLGIIEEQ
jgi:Zn-dependent protease